MISRFRLFLAAPVHPAGLNAFRFLFGLVIAWGAWRMYRDGWIPEHWAHGEFHFPYWRLDFVRPPPGDGMDVLLILLGVSALCVALGLLYRLSIVLLFAVFTYIFLVEEARYLNHFYLVCLISLLMVFVPAHRGWSLDALLRPSLRGTEIPRWGTLCLQAQVSVAMVFGGVAKLNHDWLFRLEPLRDWLSRPPHLPLVGPMQAEPPLVALWAWGALFIDLLFPLYLGWRSTRRWGMAALLSFHLLNCYWFYIGIFPWMMMGASLLWFGSRWPLALLSVLRDGPRTPPLLAGASGGLLSCLVLGGFHPVPFLTALLGFGALALRLPAEPPAPAVSRSSLPAWGCLLLAAWFALQVAVPLRHWTIPGDVAWTDEGHNFSWRMKLRDKESDLTVLVRRSGESGWERLDPLRAPRPVRLSQGQLGKMSTRPHMMAYYARKLGEELGLEGVRFVTRATLNRGPEAPLVDPERDLSRVPYPWWGHADWILPRP